ncbi:MAG: hypothetical protein J6Y82_12070 [Bacteroidales bacterium]|nr:hypothetical protein [Bacteroidales bacterium]
MNDNSNQAKRERREWTIMNLFASSYNLFPIGVITKSECPDFILKTEKKRIGIELTELKYERTDTQFNMRAHEDFLSAIMFDAQEIFERQSCLRLVVDVHFSEKIGPAVLLEPGVQEGILIRKGLSESISRIVIDNLPEATGKKYIVDRTSKYGDINLPMMIESIHIINVSGRMDESLWYASISTKVKPISVESISQRIKDKDGKLAKYDKQCDEQWLVIIQNSFLMSSLYDPVAAQRALKHHYKSKFNRVFVFERSEAKVTTLNTDWVVD